MQVLAPTAAVLHGFAGFLPRRRTFLTAAHCVYGDVDPSHYWVYLQNAGIVAVSSVTYNPSYNPSLSGSDVAIIKFATDVTGIEPTRLAGALTFTASLRTLAVSGPLAGPVTVTLTQVGAGISRGGTIKTCHPQGKALVCR